MNDDEGLRAIIASMVTEQPFSCTYRMDDFFSRSGGVDNDGEPPAS